MKRKRFTEPIIGALREQEAGAKVADLCRRHGISDATFSNWKAKYGGMDVSDAKRLKVLEDENVRLKKLLAEQMLDAVALRELLSKNGRARCKTRRRRASEVRHGPVGAAGLHDHRCRSQGDMLPLPPSAGGRAARSAISSFILLYQLCFSGLLYACPIIITSFTRLGGVVILSLHAPECNRPTKWKWRMCGPRLVCMAPRRLYRFDPVVIIRSRLRSPPRIDGSRHWHGRSRQLS